MCLTVPTSIQSSQPVSSQLPDVPQRALVLDVRKPCPMLDLSPMMDEGLNVDSFMWDTNGAVLTLSCSHGSYFTEGGKTRTLVCQNGEWPAIIPRCAGVYQLVVRVIIVFTTVCCRVNNKMCKFYFA